MYKKKNMKKSVLLVVVMLALLASPVFADGELDPVADADAGEETSGFYDNPVVQIIAGFFSDLLNPVVEEEEPIDDQSTPDSDGELPEKVIEPVPTVDPLAAVAAMREEDDLGNGEIVKLLGIVENAQAVCEETGKQCDVTYEGLLEEYKNGEGIGTLFAKYGKPENLGVGQIRKELDPKEKTNNGKAKGKNK